MDIKQLLDQDQFAKLLGIELLELKRGSAIAQIFTKETHLNAAKCVQGGVLFSLADFALAAAANSYGDKLALSVECDIKFMKSAQLGILKATATERHRTHKLG